MRSVSPTSPSPNPQPVSGKGNTIRTGGTGDELVDLVNATTSKVNQLEKELDSLKKNYLVSTVEPFKYRWIDDSLYAFGFG